jgi:ketosteroid isomerase-like protein
MWGRWSYTGADEWRAVVTRWFDSLDNERVAVEWLDVHTIVGEDVAGAHTFVTFKGLSADGEELRAMHNRLTWALRKTPEGAWKIVHEHTSAPIDFETSKVILDR